MPVSAYLQSVAFFIVMAAALFASAGTIAIATYWAYLAIYAAVFLASFVLLDPDLARERMRPGGNRPPPALRLFSALLIVHWIVAGLDRGRFHFTDTVPPWLQWGALWALAAGYALCLWAMRVNRFFSSVVRIQSDRGHVVVTAGPYAFVRHPGYLAGIIIMAASGIALDSWLAAALLTASGLPFLMHRGRSLRIVCCTPSCRATANTHNGCAGAWCRGCGEGGWDWRPVGEVGLGVIRIRNIMEYIVPYRMIVRFCSGRSPGSAVA